MATEISDTEAQIRSAIRDRIEVDLTYRGRNRLCRPHVLYRDANGTLLLEAYQVGGHSGSGALPSWRCMRVDEIDDVAAGQTTFEPAGDYNPMNRVRYVHLIAWIGQPRLVE